MMLHNDYKLNVLLYADDLVLLCTSCVGLQNNIDRDFIFLQKKKKKKKKKNGASELIMTNKNYVSFKRW